jgi:putative DNA primase/helicase
MSDYGYCDIQFDKEGNPLGVYYFGPDAVPKKPKKAKDGESGPAEGGEPKTPDPIWVADPVVAMALTVDEQDCWGKLLKLRNPDKKWITCNMPDRRLAEGDKLWGDLRELGLNMTTNPTHLGFLKAYLSAMTVKERCLCVNRLGWFDREGQLSYVLPNRVIGPPKNTCSTKVTASQIYYQGDHLAYAVRGTIEDWQRQIGQYCRGNSRLLFMVSAAFITPLLHPLGEQSGGFHIPGLSTTGKTTVVKVANSVSGWKILTWRHTDNNLESVAEQRCDSVLVLDEIGQVDGRKVGQIVYMIANGEGKGRADPTARSKPVKMWRVILLSSGEATLADKMNEAGEKPRGGQETRFVEIPEDAGAGMGCFEDIHGAVDARAFADQLGRATAEVSGAAFGQYLEDLVAVLNGDDRAWFLKSLREQIDAFVNTNAGEVTAQVKRVCGRFALAAVAGELATSLGITGWESGEATQAAQTCYRAWLAKRGHSGDNDIALGIRQVIATIEKSAVSRFQPLNAGDGEFVQTYNQNRLGFRKTQIVNPAAAPTKTNRSVSDILLDPLTAEPAVEMWHYYMLPEAWKEITKGYNPTTIAKAMHQRGLLLKKEAGQYTSKIWVPGEGHVRVYCLSPSILEGSSLVDSLI